MVRVAAVQRAVIVGTVLIASSSCGADPTSHAVDLSHDAASNEARELAAKPAPQLVPLEQSRGVNVCASETIVAQAVPVNLYFMLDRSGSMHEGNKWGQSMAALRAFIQDPSNGGLRMALRFFGDNEPTAGCSQHECNLEACAQPLVELGELSVEFSPRDTQEAALFDILEHTLPLNGFGTPIYPALGGALLWATNYKAQHAEENVAVVLLTDGEPNGCDTNIDHISALASDAYARAAVRTYAIGLEGSSEQQVHQIALAGQTEHAIFIGESVHAETELLAALNAVRAQTMSCDLLLPSPDSGEDVDPRTVNLTLSSAQNDAQLYRVDDVTACADDGLGWYFDDAEHPARMHLCPSACAASNQTSDAHLNVVVGCMPTRRKPPLVR